MRTKEKHQKRMWSYVSDEERIPENHPLRAMSAMVNAILRDMSPHFARLYAEDGRASVPPERLLRALLLQMFYSIRSERMLVEQLRYNILFRWFVGLEMDEAVWHPTTFTKNRERLLQGNTGREFFERVVELAREKHLMSDEHFTVDGTLIEAWAGQKSFRPKNGPPNDMPGKNPDVDFSQAPRRNETHASTTDPDARLYRKSLASEARLCYSAHVLMENRHGLVTDIRLTTATGTAEREAALEMAALIPTRRRVTIGGDKGYDISSFTKGLRALRITPHVASRIKYSSLDGRTMRHAGYQISQRKRKRVEEIFGWMKTVAGFRKTRHRGRDRVGWMLTLTAAAFNLVRIRNLQAIPA